MADVWIFFLVVLSCALTGGLFAAAVRSSQDIRAAGRRIDSLGSQVMATPCGRVEYIRVGEGYPVLAVHGAMGGFDQGLWVARAFDVTRHQVIAVSRFGYLNSPIPAGADLNMQADAFAALLDALNIPQAAVFGISAGSTSAIRFAARHPQRVSALILFGPDAPGKTQLPLPPRFIFDVFLRSDFLYWLLVTLVGSWMRTSIGLVPKGYRLTPANAALIKQIQLGDLPVSRRVDGLIFESYDLLSEFTASVGQASPYPLHKIDVPVLVINADDDPISVPENVRNLVRPMPNVRMVRVPDGGHFLFGHTEDVRAEIGRFLTSLAEKKASMNFQLGSESAAQLPTPAMHEVCDE